MSYQIHTEVRFRDLDALGHVNSSVILGYLEHARVEYFLREIGIPTAADLPFILASAHAEYRAPIPASRALTIGLWTSRIGTKSWDFDYQVTDQADGTLYAEGRTVQVAYDYTKNSTIRIPAALREHLKKLTPAHPPGDP
jgi:acyl-CoA thioester hydrolase